MTARWRWAVVGAVALVALVGIVVVGMAVVVRSPAVEQPAGPPIATATPVLASTTVIPETATPSATPSAEDEVGAAYLASWAAYTRAVRELDPSGLDAVMTGPMLDRTRAEIADLQNQGRAARIVVDHHFVVARIDAVAGTATIVDEYVNRSYLVNAETGERIGAVPPPHTVSDTFYLVRENDQWKVRDSVRTVFQ
ncbi:MAG: hypothetical protein WEB13_12340 [Dehalococcoidia bacterium]